MSLRFLPPRLALCRLAVLASILIPLLKKSAYLQRKKYPVGWRSCMKRSMRRPFTPVPLSLPPDAITVLLWAAISYSPRLLGNLAIPSLVYLFHAVQPILTSSESALMPLPFMIDATHRLAYPLGEKLEGIANARRIHEGNNRNGT